MARFALIYLKPDLIRMLYKMRICQTTHSNGYRALLLLMVISIAMLAACGGDDDPAPDNEQPTLQPTNEVVDLPSSTPTPSLTPGGPTLTPSPTFPPTVTPQPQQDIVQIAETTDIPPTDVPAPYIHRVEEGQTCGGIAVRYGLDIAGGSVAIEQANEISCRALQIGSEIRVPRPTSTPTPPGLDATETAIATALPPGLRNVTPYALYEYCVEEGDTLTSIALKNGTTQRRICELNPLPDGLDCRGCDFSESSVGFCPQPPVIGFNQCLIVPGPTHTPTATPTFTGQETATPTPTFVPPQAVQPANGTTLRGAVQLIWLSVGQLKGDEYYQVAIIDEQTGEQHFDIVKSTNYLVPQQWLPASGQTRNIMWSVQVVRVDEQSGLHLPVNDASPIYRFVWQG
jgi:LysM repeat protein